MPENKRNINEVIHDSLIGQANDEELLQLREWINRSPENKKNYEHLLHESSLSERYRQYSSVNADRARSSFRKSHFPSRTIIRRNFFAYAAIFVLVAGIAAIWFIVNTHQAATPPISHETMVAMLRAQNQGKQKATLILPGGKKVALQSLTAVDEIEKSENNSVQQTSQESVVDNRLITQGDEEYWVTLEDGTKVHLNYGTTLKYPTRFSDDSRTVYLDGEAYFYVAKDAKRPFNVVTPNGTVREYGTSFNVNTHDEIGKTKVVLVEGSISVINSRGNEYRIKPGELAIVEASSQRIQISKVNIDPYIAWNSGRFVFDNCPLEKLMDKISLWYGKKVIFMSDDARQMCYTGDIDRYSSITLVLKAIRNVTGLEIENSGNKIVIKNSNND